MADAAESLESPARDANMNATVHARTVTALTAAGIIVRYSFYLVGLFVFGAVALGILWVSSNRPKRVAAEPSFRVAAAELDGLARTSEIVTVAGGRSEAVSYGELYHHHRDMTLIVLTPPQGRPLARDFAHEMAAIPVLRKARARLQPVFYDLETRFGSLRAAEMQVDVDGRRKLCLAFLSRFETPYLYMKGWICEASGAKPGTDNLACLINRIVLDAPLAEPRADAFLRAGLSRGPTCYATPVTQTTDTRPHRSSPRRRYY
jgi:hypothetical protein